MKVNAILLKPLDGYEPGSPRQFDKADFERLRAMNAVKEATTTDPVEDVPATDDVRMLEQLRHPVEGPKILADLKLSFENQATEITRLTGQLSAANASIGTLTSERDEAARDRDAALLARDEARNEAESAQKARSALVDEIAGLRAQSAGADHVATGKAKPGKPQA